MRGTFEEKSRPPLLPSISAHVRLYVPTASPSHRPNHINSRNRADAHRVLISHKIQQKTFFLQLGQNGYQKTQNFTLIPNPKTKFRKSAPIKIYFKKLANRKKQFFHNNFLFVKKKFPVLL